MKSIGTSQAASASEAGREAAGKIAKGLPDAKFAWAFGSCDYGSKELLGAVAEALPGVAVVGNTSFTGIITPEGYLGGDKPFVGLLALAGRLECGGAPRASGARGGVGGWAPAGLRRQGP